MLKGAAARFRPLVAPQLAAGRRRRRGCRGFRGTPSASVGEPGQAPEPASSSASSSGYETLAVPSRYELEVNKSRFVALGASCATPAAALAFVQEVSSKDAGHNCWGYRIGGEARGSDDGEPGGTARGPILASLEASGLDRVCVVVSRWRKGPKLGAGPLARAYGRAAADLLGSAPRARVRPRAAIVATFAFADAGAVQAVLDRFERNAGAGSIRRGEAAYTDAGVVMPLEVDASDAPAIVDALTQGSQGRVACDVADSVP